MVGLGSSLGGFEGRPPALARADRPATPSAHTQGVPAAQPQLTAALAGLRHTFVVADATLPDCPLIYASEGCELARTAAHAAAGQPQAGRHGMACRLEGPWRSRRLCAS